MADIVNFEIEEVWGEVISSLESAQQAAKPELIRFLAEKIRAMIEDGSLQIKDGVIIPGSEK